MHITPAETATGEDVASPWQEDIAGPNDEAEDALSQQRSTRQERFRRDKLFAQRRCKRRGQESLFDFVEPSLCEGAVDGPSDDAKCESRIGRERGRSSRRNTQCAAQACEDNEAHMEMCRPVWTRGEIDEEIERRLVALRGDLDQLQMLDRGHDRGRAICGAAGVEAEARDEAPPCR